MTATSDGDPRPAIRRFLATRAGLFFQAALIALGAVALPGAAVLSPVLMALLAALLLWLAGDNWRIMGFGRPSRRLFVWLSVGFIVGLLWQYAAAGFVGPGLNRWLLAATPAPAVSAMWSTTHSLGFPASVLIFGFIDPLAKTLAYRGFLLNRLERLAGASPAALALSLLVASLVFGLANAYQGLGGFLVAALTGLVFNALYYWARRNVWPTLLAHAVYNLAALALLYAGTL